jgi:hypothetical protein
MKIILSRKGFDSANGGSPSPILQDRRMISFPIPSNDSTKYSDLMVDNNQSYYELMRQLVSKIKYNKGEIKLTKDTKCHLDPDIYASIIYRMENWKPSFGQIDQAQSHLDNEGVKENDLFLFFGWFNKTILKNGIIRFVKPDLHIIFGYLQIGEILKVNTEKQIPNWLKNHPHGNDKKRREKSNNTIYIARDNLTWDKSKPGAGIFKFQEDLVLTKTGFSRSKWELPLFFKGKKISRHSEKSWNKEGYFKSVDIGQEFVIEDNMEVENWAKQIINNNIVAS